MDQITLQYPTWYLLFCGLLGLFFSLLLYYRNDSLANFSRSMIWLLAGFRFIGTSALAVLLLSPLIKSTENEIQKPIIVIAQDASESIGDGFENKEMQADFVAKIEKIEADLSEKYSIESFSFGEEVRSGLDFDFGDKASNMAAMIGHLNGLYSNQNLAAMILISDGIINQGANPIYANSAYQVPIYTVGMGDTTLQKDLLLKRVLHNEIAYLDNEFTIQVDVSAFNLGGSSSRLTVSQISNGKKTQLNSLDINIKRNNFFISEEIVLQAKQAGVQHYRIEASSLEGESSINNNVKDIFIDVLDTRQEILILYNSPHPDISAIKQILKENKNYEVTEKQILKFKGNIADFDLIVWHQLPSKNNSAVTLLNQAKQKKIPSLFIIGSQSQLTHFNQNQNLVSIKSTGTQTNLVQANIDPNFSFFTISDRLRTQLPNFSPLIAPFGEFDLGINGVAVLNQKIGKIDTQYPLLILGEENNTKIGVLTAEGLWKWRLFDFLQNSNHDLVQEIIGKSIQFLNTKEDKRRFKVTQDKNIFVENEELIFNAQLYNANYESINEPEVQLSVNNIDENREYNFIFSRINQAYRLNAGILPVGNYSYTARTNFQNEELKFSGKFSIQALQLEAFQTRADHNLLSHISKQSGARMFLPNQITALSDTLIAQELKPVIYSTHHTQSAIHWRWMFSIFAFLFFLEWFLRRYFGSY